MVLRGKLRRPMEPSRTEHQPGPRSSLRHEQRSIVSLSVIVLGINDAGLIFYELATTRNVSRHGCCIHLHTEPQNNTPLALHVVPRMGPIPEGAPPISYQLIWKRQAKEGWDVGAQAQGEADLLQAAFPATAATSR